MFSKMAREESSFVNLFSKYYFVALLHWKSYDLSIYIFQIK